MILIFLGTSALCDSISAYLIKGAAAKISKEMRYDLYICYHQKCGYMTEPIDEGACRKFFNFNEIQKDVANMESNLNHHMPLRWKRIILSIGALSFMF